MNHFKRCVPIILLFSTLLLIPTHSSAWFDETHIAIAKVAGYQKWFNAAGADVAKMKLGDKEGDNHFVNNPRGTIVTPQMVLSQVAKYDKIQPAGHLYGAIIASVKNYIQAKKMGRYGEYHLAYCAHYVGDLSQPLHNILYYSYNRKNHMATDGIINDEVLNNLDKIKIYPITVNSEADLAREIARIANISMNLGYRLEGENRLLSKEEAYQQIGHSASLFRAVLKYVEGFGN